MTGAHLLMPPAGETENDFFLTKTELHMTKMWFKLVLSEVMNQ